MQISTSARGSSPGPKQRRVQAKVHVLKCMHNTTCIIRRIPPTPKPTKVQVPMACSTMIFEAGFIPPFFDCEPVLSPIPKIVHNSKEVYSIFNIDDDVIDNAFKMKGSSEPNVKDLAFKVREKQREERRQARKMKGSSELIDLDVMLSPKVKEPSMWVHNLNTEDEKVLLNGEWMNDKLMNDGQMLIKESYPQVCDFQDVSLGQTLGFDVLTEEFVQVLHTGRGHWLTVSTFRCTSAEVDIFDSMPPAINSSLQNQIASLLCTKRKNISLRYFNC